MKKKKKSGDGRDIFYSAFSELRLSQKSPVGFRATTCVLHCLKWKKVIHRVLREKLMSENNIKGEKTIQFQK